MTELEGTPRPHYLVGVEKISGDGASLRGWVLFPSTDPSVGDRVDHVNVAHHLFAVWNAAHLMCRQAGIKLPRAYETTATCRRPTAPDTRVSIEAAASIEKEDSRRVFGIISAIFREGGNILCEVSAKYVAQRT